MPLSELKRLIDRFKNQKDDTPISLVDSNARTYAIQELLSICSSSVHMLMWFDEFGESALFDALADDKTSKLMSRFLDFGKVSIVTNDTATFKKLPFFEKLSEDATKRILVSPIPKKLANEYINDRVDNEFFLASPEHLIFFGKYLNKERVSEPRAFLNFYDQDFYKVLLQFFETTNLRASLGEFK